MHTEQEQFPRKTGSDYPHAGMEGGVILDSEPSEGFTRTLQANTKQNKTMYKPLAKPVAIYLHAGMEGGVISDSEPPGISCNVPVYTSKN